MAKTFPTTSKSIVLPIDGIEERTANDKFTVSLRSHSARLILSTNRNTVAGRPQILYSGQSKDM